MSSRVTTRGRTNRILFFQGVTQTIVSRGDRPWDTSLIQRFTENRRVIARSSLAAPSVLLRRWRNMNIIPMQHVIWFNRFVFDVIIRIRSAVRNWIRRRRERLGIAVGWPVAWNVVEINPNAPVLGQRAVAGVGAIRRSIPVRTRWQPYRRANRREWGRY